MTLEIFIGRNLKIEYDTNTTGRRLCHPFVKNSGTENLPETNNKQEGDAWPGGAAAELPR